MSQTSNNLTSFFDDQFHAELGVCSTAEGLFHALENSSSVQKLRSSFKSRAIKDLDLRKFVNDLCQNLESGVQFPFETELAAIAVAVYPFPNRFTEEYLIDLAAINRIEFCIAPSVAKVCIRRQRDLIKSRSTNWSHNTQTNRVTKFLAKPAVKLNRVNSNFANPKTSEWC